MDAASDAAKESAHEDAPIAPGSHRFGGHGLVRSAGLQSQVAGSNDCTSAQVDAIWTACAATGATEATCETALTAAAACGACITGSGEPATRKTGLFTFEESAAVSLNYLCEANAIGQAAECGTKLDNQTSCLIGGCMACLEGDDDAATQACVETASAGPCAQFAPTVDCEALLGDDANDAAIADKCGDLEAETITEADFKKATLYMCGPALQ